MIAYGYSECQCTHSLVGSLFLLNFGGVTIYNDPFFAPHFPSPFRWEVEAWQKQAVKMKNRQMMVFLLGVFFWNFSGEMKLKFGSEKWSFSPRFAFSLSFFPIKFHSKLDQDEEDLSTILNTYLNE